MCWGNHWAPKCPSSAKWADIYSSDFGAGPHTSGQPVPQLHSQSIMKCSPRHGSQSVALVAQYRIVAIPPNQAFHSSSATAICISTQTMIASLEYPYMDELVELASRRKGQLSWSQPYWLPIQYWGPSGSHCRVWARIEAGKNQHQKRVQNCASTPQGLLAVRHGLGWKVVLGAVLPFELHSTPKVLIALADALHGMGHKKRRCTESIPLPRRFLNCSSTRQCEEDLQKLLVISTGCIYQVLWANFRDHRTLDLPRDQFGNTSKLQGPQNACPSSGSIWKHKQWSYTCEQAS